MSFEEYEDDFGAVNESTSDSEQMQRNNEDESVTKPSKLSFLKNRLFIKCVSVLSVILVVVVFFTAFFTNDIFKKYRNNFIVNIKIIDTRLGISEKFGQLFATDEGETLKMREENKAAGTTYDNETYLIPFENASNSRFELLDSGVIIAKSNFIGRFNEKGETIWSSNTSVVNPILDVDGKYVLIAENGGTKVCLYEGDKLIYEADAQNTILNASVSSVGDVVVVTEKEFFKGAVEVFNKIGERVFSWSSGTNTVICADISPSSRRIAVAFLDSRNGINGSVQLFNVDESESYKNVEIPGTAIFNLEFTGETLNVFGDNRFVGLSVHGSVKWDETFDGDLSAYAIDKAGNKAAVVDSHNVPLVLTYKKDGNGKNEFSTDELPDFVDINGKQLLYNNTRMILFGKGNKPQKYAATMDVKGLKIIDSNTYLIIYSNSLEFVHV